MVISAWFLFISLAAQAQEEMPVAEARHDEKLIACVRLDSITGVKALKIAIVDTQQKTVARSTQRRSGVESLTGSGYLIDYQKTKRITQAATSEPLITFSLEGASFAVNTNARTAVYKQALPSVEELYTECRTYPSGPYREILKWIRSQI